MSAPRIGSELGMVLAAEKPRMVGKLDHLAKIARGRAFGPRTDAQSRGFQPRQVMIVDLVTMPVALGDRRRAIDAVRKRAGNDLAGLRTEPHGSAQIGTRVAALDRSIAILPLGDQRDDWMRRIGLEFRAVRIREARFVPGGLDDGELHAEAN